MKWLKSNLLDIQFIYKTRNLVTPILWDNYLKKMNLLKETSRFSYRQCNNLSQIKIMSSSSVHPEVFLKKGVLKICSKFTGERPWQSVISIKLQSNFIEIALWRWCSHVNLLHIFRTSFLKNTSGRMLRE